LNHFGEGGGCSEMPSEAPTSSMPTRNTPQPSLSLGIEAKSGCTALNSGNTCARELKIESKLVMPRGMGPLNNRFFGNSVTFVGSARKIVAVGSGAGNSAVFIYSKPDNRTWEFMTTISLPSSERTNVLFGASLDSNEEGYIVVGAPYWSGGVASGMAYVYRPNADMTDWAYVAKFEPAGEDIESGEELAESFGISVAIYGGLIAIGSPDERNGKGAVYIFERTGNSWGRSIKLSPDSGVSDRSYFGTSVSLYGDSPPTLAVGAPGDAGGGSAFVFMRPADVWLPQKLTSRDIQDGDDFGSGVVISGCTIAVISPKDRTEFSTGAGSVRIFNWDENLNYWAHSQIVEPFDFFSGEVFGRCLAMEGNTMLIGSPTGGEDGEASGLIYHFERIAGVWTPISTIPNRDYVSGDDDNFGCPLSLSGDMFVAGSRGDSTQAPFSGSAFIYDLCPDIDDELV